MKNPNKLWLPLALVGVLFPQVLSSKSIEELNSQFEEHIRQQEGRYEQTVTKQEQEFEFRQRELNRKFEQVREKVLNLFGNDPVKAKGIIWQGEQERDDRYEIKLEPNLRVEVANVEEGKIEVTAVTVASADTETATRQAGQEAKDIARYKLAERVKEIIQSQFPAGHIDPKRVNELVETGVQHSEPVFVRDRAPEQQPLCYMKARIPIFNSDPTQRESTVESIIRHEIPKPAPPVSPSVPAPRKASQSAKLLEYIRKPANKGPCTGLIIDARGKGFSGKPLIRIFSEDDSEYAIYSVQVAYQRDNGIRNIYGHCADLDNARSITRVTSNPIILPAKAVQKGIEIILTKDDAYALNIANLNNFLSRGRVIIVYEGGNDGK